MKNFPFVGQVVWMILGLSCLVTGCMQESVTDQRLSHLLPLSPTPLVKTISFTPAPTSGSDLFAAVTSFPTPTEQEISGACEVVFSLEGWETQGVQGTRFFAVAPDSSIWIADYRYPCRLLRFSLEGELLQEILESGEYYLLDLDVTQAGIWLLEVVTPFNNASYVAHLGFDGLLRNRHEVPKKFYVKADGQYADFGSGSIEWGGNGELLIETETGLHQLLDANGNLRPVKLVAGYASDGHIYRVENGVDGLPTAGALFVDHERLVITTAMESLFLKMAGFASDGSFYVEIHEFSGTWAEGTREEYLTVHHYSSQGDLLAVARIPDAVSGPEILSTALGADGGMYVMISRPDAIRICRLHFTAGE